ncbi:SIS domain-containing protein [Methanoregula sp.]|jgi:D-sedoheptulose 7-phosphate isomerase|uniref:D-sedoheptulose-7-phosphate isomerase n=1 Tax=Methanoregula sp. TaxID=2052170 RepID=UPI0035637027
MRHDINQYIQQHQEMIRKVSEDEVLKNKILKVSDLLVHAYKNNKRLYIFGCGGSAADAQHIAAEFINKINFPRQSLPAIALTTDTSILTAVGNDDEFSNIFKRQVEGLVAEQDIVLGISTSGTSESVVRGLKAAKEKKAITFFFTGECVKEIPGVTDYVINVPSKSTPSIQEAHIMIGHMVCTFVERELFHEYD